MVHLVGVRSIFRKLYIRCQFMVLVDSSSSQSINCFLQNHSISHGLYWNCQNTKLRITKLRKLENINKTLTWMHLSSPILGKPTCRCVTGFTGPNCERRVCDNHCLNGGTCHISPGNQPVCRCLAEYTGDRCLYRKYCKRLLVPSRNGQQLHFNSIGQWFSWQVITSTPRPFNSVSS